MSKEIKVVFILATDKGGMLHYLSQLANAITKYAHVIVIGPKQFPYYYFLKSVEVKNILDCPIGKKLSKCLSFMNLRVIKEIDPDIIHLTMAHHILIAFFIHILGIDKRYSIVYTHHDPQTHIDRNPFEVIGNFFYRHIVKIDRFIVHGKALKNLLVRDGVPEDKIAVIPHGDYSFFKTFINAQKNVSAEKNCILFFGSIRDYKGLEYLIRSVPIISEQIPDVKVIIAGAGNFSRYHRLIMDCSKFEIHNRFIPDREVPELFQRAKLLVLPYTEATQSGPLHIAYAFRKPVVATTVGAIPEIVEHGKTGLLVPPRDIGALADSIIKLLKNDKLRREMGENAQMKLEKELSWDKIAKKTIEVYKEVISNKRNEKQHKQ